MFRTRPSGIAAANQLLAKALDEAGYLRLLGDYSSVTEQIRSAVLSKITEHSRDTS